MLCFLILWMLIFSKISFWFLIFSIYITLHLFWLLFSCSWRFSKRMERPRKKSPCLWLPGMLCPQFFCSLCPQGGGWKDLINPLRHRARNPFILARPLSSRATPLFGFTLSNRFFKFLYYIWVKVLAYGFQHCLICDDLVDRFVYCSSLWHSEGRSVCGRLR